MMAKNEDKRSAEEQLQEILVFDQRSLQRAMKAIRDPIRWENQKKDLQKNYNTEYIESMHKMHTRATEFALALLQCFRAEHTTEPMNAMEFGSGLHLVLMALMLTGRSPGSSAALLQACDLQTVYMLMLLHNHDPKNEGSPLELETVLGTTKT